MSPERGWTDSNSTLIRWRVMRAMARDVREGKQYTSGTAVATDLGIEPRQVADVFDRLAHERLATALPAALAPGYTEEAILASQGVAMVEGWESATGTTLLRACSQALLWWLDSLPEGTRATTTGFLADVRASYYGEPYSRSIIANAVREQREAGAIHRGGSWQDGLLMAELTATGRLIISRHNGDVDEWSATRSSAGAVITVHGSTGVNIANHSPNSRQVAIANTGLNQQVAELADALEQVLPMLKMPPTTESDAKDLVTQLRNAANEVGADPTRARQIVVATRDFLVGATSSAAGAALIALAENIL